MTRHDAQTAADQRRAREQPKRSGLRDQFAHPTGALGWLAGRLMAVADRERSVWVLSLLALQPADRVLEVGYGPGEDLKRVSRVVTEGYIAGVDASETMARQARRRNAAAIRAGRMALARQPIAEPLPFAGATFDVVYSINSFQFWPEPLGALHELRRALKPGGRIAIAVQPLHAGATDDASRAAGQTLSERLTAAGFTGVRLEWKPMRPTAVVCALATA